MNINNLTLREKIGQLLCLRYGIQDKREDIEKLIKEGFGSVWAPVHFSQKSSYEVIKKDIIELRKIAKYPLLFCADTEMGTAQYCCHNDEVTDFPLLMAFGAIKDYHKRVELSYKAGETMAKEASNMGIDVLFAPVADVNTEVSNPIINNRSAGDTSELVCSVLIPMVKGIEDKNFAMSTLKHFPGAGGCKIDPHYSLPIIEKTVEEMEKVHFLPFETAFSSGASFVMTNHSIYTAYDKKYPATLSKKIMTGILRDKMGFEGIAITDSMDMGGAKGLFSDKEALVLAINAGCDIILDSDCRYDSIDIVEKAVNDGIISIDRIDESVNRVIKAKSKLKKYIGNEKSPNGKLTKEICGASITVYRDEKVLIPMKDDGNILIIEPEQPEELFHFGLSIRRTLLFDIAKEYATDLSVHTFSISPTIKEIEEIRALSKKFKYVFISTSFYSNAGQIGILTEKQIDYVRLVVESNQNSIFIVSNPYVVSQLPFAKTIVINYSTIEQSVRSAFDVIFGNMQAIGKLPISI